MPIDRTTLLFFDASCLIVASHRPDGGSGFILRLCQRRLLRCAVSWPVLWETETNLLAKFPPSSIDMFHRYLVETPFVMAPTPTPGELARYQALVNGKDAHVAAAAMSINADYLLTLDRPFEAEVAQAGLSVRATSPGTFIKRCLVEHPDASILRDDL